MLKLGKWLFLLSFGFFAPLARAADDSPRLLVHLLDYLAKDYGGAVAPDGSIKSPGEYQEQLEFSQTAAELGVKAPGVRPATQQRILALKELIAQKADPARVSSLARELQAEVIQATHLPTAPTAWPDQAHGRETYQANCASCHGAEGRGDGPAAAALDPKPANFLDTEGMAEVSPLQAYNTVRLGVPGTGMPAFPTLADGEAWGVAFFVVSLRYQKEDAASLSKSWDSSLLSSLATKNDATLRQELSGTDAERNAEIAALRLHSESQTPLALAETLLSEALAAYQAGDVDEARSKALRAYLDGIEPVEPRLRVLDPEVVSALEQRMSIVRSALEARQSVADVGAVTEAARREIAVAAKALGTGQMAPSVAFIAAAAIILREGFEAVLLILALLGVIKGAGDRRAALWVHAGWLSALALGGLAWFFSGYLLDLSGAKREVMEGFTSLFAVAVLLVVGFWLHSQTEIGRWQRFLNIKVRAALAGKKLFALASISFIAVFREAFETVLFLRAVWLEGGATAKVAMASGTFVTLGLIIFAAWVILRYSVRLPLRRLFAASAAVMAVLAFVLTGKGLHSLQETGALGVTAAWPVLRSDLFGLYPTYETLLPQILVLALAIALWHFGRRPSLVKVRAREKRS